MRKIHFKNYPSLKGRKCLSPKDLSHKELKSLIYTAKEMKEKQCNHELEKLAQKNISYLSHKPCIVIQTCLSNTAALTKMSLNILMNPNWENCLCPQEIGKLLSCASDIIFVTAQRHSKIQRFSDGSTVPVVNLSCCRFSTLEILSDLMTLHEHFGYLRGLKLAWLGSPCPLLNTYLDIGPRCGLDIKYMCGQVSPAALHDVLPQYKVEECQTVQEVITGANIIAANCYDETNVELNMSDIEKYADKNWTLLHTFPRKTKE